MPRRVGVKHEFDPVGRHIGSKIFGVGPSGAPSGGDASPDTLTGGNTWDSMDRLVSSSCVYATWPAPPIPRAAADPAYLSFDQPESLADLDEYDRMGRLKHAVTEIIGSTQFLILDYDYDSRGRIDKIIETEGAATTEVDYSYDDRGRLTREKRCTPNCTTPSQTIYDLEYHYDQGGNREYKWDWVNSLVTDYEYDPGNNQLTAYEVRVIGTTDVVEKVVYDYFHEEDKAGNVRRVARMVPDAPGPAPASWTGCGTDSEYHRDGELRMIVQRTGFAMPRWREPNFLEEPDPSKKGRTATRELESEALKQKRRIDDVFVALFPVKYRSAALAWARDSARVAAAGFNSC